jgi:hypothetical protein
MRRHHPRKNGAPLRDLAWDEPASVRAANRGILGMKFRIFMATATAASVLMAGGAMADSNRSTIKQVGDGNSAQLVQDGSNNKIGNPLVNTTYGKVVQTGDENSIDILQKGINNDISSWAGGNNNVKQDGDRNSIVVRQYSGTVDYTGNVIYGIDQDSVAGATAWANALTISQGTDLTKSRHAIGNVIQNNDTVAQSVADGNAVEITQVGTPGYATGQVVRLVKQDGSGNTLTISQSVNNNLVWETVQEGRGNSGTIIQAGGQNTVALLSQDVGNSLAGGNTARIELNGDRNGTGAAGKVTQAGASAFNIDPSYYARENFSGVAGAGSNIVAVVEQAKVVQWGGNNELQYVVTSGNRNLYGFRQVGDDNSITGSVSGDDHQLAVLQQGNGNILAYVQSGIKNSAGVAVVGNYNRLNIQQNQSGGLQGNVTTVSVTGDSNGAGTFPSPSSLSSLANANGLISGDIIQSGAGNSVSLTISTNLNNFAFKQSGGNDNSITASVLGGDSNRAVGVQNGSGNSASMTQNGANNATLFHQVGGTNSVTISQ